MEKQAELQETDKIQYEDTHKKAFFNRCRKESTRLGVKSEVSKGAIADELARFKKHFTTESQRTQSLTLQLRLWRS